MIPPLTLTVGPADADIIGVTHLALQAGVDSLARQGGGTLRLRPGAYQMSNAVHLPSRVRLQGSGEDTVLRKTAMASCPLKADADWYLEHIEPVEPSMFEVGQGVLLHAHNSKNGGPDHFQIRTIIGRDGERLLLDHKLEQNFWLDCGAEVLRLHSLIHALDISQVEIRDLVLDGNRAENGNINGNYAAGIFMQSCHDINVENITVRDFNGDGMSWQIVHDMTVTGCRSLNNAGLGLHPGSGSQRPIIRDNEIDGCNIGIFFCWGVKRGLAEGNRIRNIATHGVSIGHRDTDNIVRRNQISDCAAHGIYLRPEPTPDRHGHRNLIEANDVTRCPVGIHVDGTTDQTTLRSNRVAGCPTAVRIGSQAGQVTLDGNDLTASDKVLDDQRPNRPVSN